MQNALSKIVSVRLLALLVMLGNCAFCEAQESAALPVECALNTRSLGEISPIAFSRDGKWLAYMVRDNERARPKEERGINRDHYVRTGLFLGNETSDVWISNTATGESRNLTGRKGSNWDPAWSPDGHYLAFLSDRDGSGQARLWIWDAHKDALRMATSENVRSAYPAPGIEWTPDSQHVLISIVPQQLSLSEYVRRALSPSSSAKPSIEAALGATVALYQGAATLPEDVAAARASRYNLDAYALADLVLVGVDGGKVTTVARGHRVGWYSVSPDGLQVAYTIPVRLDAEGRFRKVFDLVSVDLSSGAEHVIVSGAILTDVFTWSPDARSLTYGVYESGGTTFFSTAAGGGQPRKISQLPHTIASFAMPVWDACAKHLYLLADGALWRIPVAGGNPEQVARIPGRRIVGNVSQPNGALWSGDNGRSTVVLVRDEIGKQHGFYKVDLTTGATTKLLEDGHCYDCNVLGSGLGLGMVAAAGPYLAFSAENAQHAPDLWVSDFDFRSPRQLTHLNPEFERYEMGSARLIDWLGDDGERLQGALLLPPGYQREVRYPLLVYVYPTLLSNELSHFAFGEFPGPFNLQLFATRGYAVLLPDMKDEQKYGMAGLAKSALPGISKVVEMGIADPERIGVMGHSFGGYATVALLVQTGRFKAALEASGMSDLGALYGQLDVDGLALPADEMERSVVGVAPWQDPLRYVGNSPFYYLDRVKTPLLIVHGSKDEAASSSLSDQVFVGMRRLGREVEYAKYEGESHVPRDWSYGNQLDLCRRTLRWFETHLKDRPGGDAPP
jgi:dipeptidyl aminopeptidase/acylaminoacyl peptidase